MSRFRLAAGDTRWPACLSDLGALRGCPWVHALWVEGELPALPGVAVVGSRRASVAGVETARRIAGDLARRGVTVVSGLARGVDSAAHGGCLGAGGRTVAVLGCGLDVDYPPQNSGLRRKVGASGALISEYGLDDAPLSWHFPHRNRIIAGLCSAVVVVEARVGSGALSTARWALDLGREVLAVPGSILGRGNEGSNRLLRDGARPYLDVSDIEDLLPAWARAQVPPPRIDGSAHRDPGTGRQRRPDGDRSRLLAIIGAEAVHRESLGVALGLGASELAVLVGEMELAGSIRTLPGGLVSRTRW